MKKIASLFHVKYFKKRNSAKPFFFNQLPIGVKYILAFGISIALFVTATAIVYMQLQTANQNVSDIIHKNKLTADMAALALLMEKQHANISDYIIVGNIRYISNFKETEEELTALTDSIANLLSDDAESNTLLERLQENNKKVSDTFLNKIANASSTEEGTVYFQIKIGALKTANVASINRLIDMVNEKQKAAETNIYQNMKKSTAILILSSIISIVIGLFTMIIISRIISRRLKKVVAMTTEVANGNLTIEKMDYKGKDEIGQLTIAVNQLIDNFRGILTKVNTSSAKVADKSVVVTNAAKEMKLGSEQIAVTMEELALGSESQAGHATDLASRMLHFVNTVKQSEEKGQQITNESRDVLAVTADGMTMMEQSVQQMNRIDQIVSDSVKRVQSLDNQSEEISKLVNVVKEIADQTNLLALNAAIEAARAGDHGRGFAVVADEVRKLAEQVTASITEITTIVSAIHIETDDVTASLEIGYKEVQQGIQQIEKTGVSFQSIDTSVTAMTEGILDIANRLNGIARGSEQMNQLIEDIAAVSEEAAAGIEQSSAATQEASSSIDEISDYAEELSNVAKHLQLEINAFILPTEDEELLK